MPGFRGSALVVVALGASRLPRILLFAVAGLLLGISEVTDGFFVMYAVAMFLAGVIVFAAEIMAPSPMLLGMGILLSVVAMAVLGATTDVMAVHFIPLLAATTAASVLTGVANRQERYSLVVASVLIYVPAIGLIVLLVPEWGAWALVWVFAGAEVVRIAVLRGVIGAIWSRAMRRLPLEVTALVAASALAGSVAVVDRLFALGLPTGDVTRLSYAWGVMMGVTAVATYGLVVVSVNSVGASRRVSSLSAGLTGVVLAGLGVVALSVYGLSVGSHWTARVVGPAMVFMLIMPAQLGSAVVYGRLIGRRHVMGLLWAATLMATTNAALDALVVSWGGLMGIIGATVACQYLYWGYVIRTDFRAAGRSMRLVPVLGHESGPRRRP